MTTATAPYWQWPGLDHDDRVVAGVSGGLAREIGIEPGLVRLAFVVLFALGGWGAILYGATWGAMTVAEANHPPLPAERIPKGRTPRQRRIGFVLVVAGVAALTAQVGGFPASVVTPLGLLGAGALLAWSNLTTETDPGRRRFRRRALAGLGLLLVVGALALLGQALTDVTNAFGPILVSLGAVVALAAVSAPWWWRLVRERDAERQARIRSEERAEVAAHLHDSVLQTLSLIQRSSDDPRVMVSLARRQERELRNWLDPNRVSRQGGSIRGRLDDIATDVESLHGVPVEVVVAGDCLVDDQIEALLGAAREAVVNAAKHAGADQVDLYVEVGEATIDVFVRDTGTGFALGDIDRDRHGIRQSIVARIERAGGTATITTAPGQGTEVELHLDRQPADHNGDEAP